jgi:hypothetical protein
MSDYCPARITPLPAGVPRARQLRAVVDGQDLVVMWLDPGGGRCSVRVPAEDYRARQVGCRCAANPRLVGAAVR